MTSHQIISTRRTKRGETILTLDLAFMGQWWLKNFLHFLVRPMRAILAIIDVVFHSWATKRYQLLAIAGLGFGVGLSFLFFFSPTQVQADLPTWHHRGMAISRIKSTAIGIDTPVVGGNAQTLPFVQLEAPAVHLKSSAGIGGSAPIVIQGVNKDYSLQNLSRAQPGDEIFIIGSNQGWYRYSVVAIKTIPVEKLKAEISQLRRAAILYTVNSWQKTALVVIAKPRL